MGDFIGRFAETRPVIRMISSARSYLSPFARCRIRYFATCRQERVSVFFILFRPSVKCVNC